MPDLSEEEKAEIFMRDDFQKFISKSARLVERAVYETDIFVDYTGQEDSDKDRYSHFLNRSKFLPCNEVKSATLLIVFKRYTISKRVSKTDVEVVG